MSYSLGGRSPNLGEVIEDRDYKFAVLARSGGIGKTTMSQLLSLGLRIAGIKPTLVSIDRCGVGDDVGASKLASVERDVIDVPISANLDELMRDPRAAPAVFDPVLDALLDRSHVIIDAGANIADALLDWATARNLDKMLAGGLLDLVVPTTGEPTPLNEAHRLLKRALTESFPIRKAVVALIENKGGLTNPSGPEMRDLKAYCDENQVPIIRIPWNAYLALVDTYKIAYADFWNMTLEEYRRDVSARGHTPPTRGIASTTFGDFETWAATIIGRFADADMLPKVTIPRKAFLERESRLIT